jgi:hypothetical protein
MDETGDLPPGKRCRSEEKISFGKHRCRPQNNIKIGYKGVGYEDVV